MDFTSDFQQMQQDIKKLQGDMSDLQYKEARDIAEHAHGGGATSVSLDTLIGLFEVVPAVPTTIPTGTYDQIKIYATGGVYRLYCYDYIGHAWHYVTLT